MEATLAKFWAPEQDDAAWDAFEQIEQSLRRTRIVLEQLLAAQPRQRAATIDREIEARAVELKQCGVCKPITQAREEVAKRHGYASGAALKKWLSRNR